MRQIEIRVNWLDNNDNIICSRIIDIDGWYYYPTYYIDVSNGVYYMRCDEDGVTIFELKRNNKIDKSKLKKSDKSNYADEKKEAKSLTTVAVTRTQAFLNAQSCVYHSWILTANNRTGGIDITIPNWIMAVTGLPKNVSGIPYCWGGFMSNNVFSNKISSGYQAGNINMPETGYVAGTAGLDCSGYASVAYGLSTKKSTSGFASGYTLIDWDDLCHMDYILKRTGVYNLDGYVGNGNHIIIFYNRSSSTSLLLMDCNIVTGKATIRLDNELNLIQEGYQPYRPFANGHVAETTWRYDSTYHYHLCANSCNNCAPISLNKHSFVYSGGNKTCQVCGYTTVGY